VTRDGELTLPLIHHRLGAALLVSFVCKDLDFTAAPTDFYRPLITEMDWELYAKELEKIIKAITLPENTRYLVDMLVRNAREKSAGWTPMQPGKPA
jgi:hypothetical protein